MYRYAMAKTKEVPPPPPGLKTKMTKSIVGSDSKELPPPTDNVVSGEETKSIEKPTTPDQVTKSETPGIKADVSDLGTNKDTDIGISDLKKS